MRVYLRPVLALSTLMLLFGGGPALAQANVDWDIEFDYDAAKAGSVIITLEYNLVGGAKAIERYGIPVRAGTTSEEKAALMVTEIRRKARNRYIITYTPGDDDFKIRHRTIGRPGGPAGGFTKVSITDASGEDNDAVKDDPLEGEPPPLLTGFLVLYGKGTLADGIAAFQLGDEYPRIVVSTHGKSAGQIAKEMIAAFNKKYQAHEFYALPLTGLDGLMVHEVPCPLGVRGGTSDPAILHTLGLGETPPRPETVFLPDGTSPLLTGDLGALLAFGAGRPPGESEKPTQPRSPGLSEKSPKNGG